MVMVSERPAEVDKRAVPEHYEGGLIISTVHNIAVDTLANRSTKFMLLLHVPEDHCAPAVAAAMRRAISKLPAELTKNVT